MTDKTMFNTDVLDVSASVKALLDALTYDDIRTLLGLVIGVDVQEYDPSGVTSSSTTTFTNKRIIRRVDGTDSSSAPAINTNICDIYRISALAEAITSMSLNMTGTPTDGQQLRISIVGTASRTITWGSLFENGSIPLPSTCFNTQQLDILLEWQEARSAWRCMAVGSA